MYPLAQRAAVRMSIRGRFPADGVSVVNACPVSRQRIPRRGPLSLLAVLVGAHAPSRPSSSTGSPGTPEPRSEDTVTRWIGWYNNDRIHTSVGDIPPAEYEAAYYSATITPKAA